MAERDAPAIAHLRQAGAVFVGKTNLHEFAFGTTNEDSAFGLARNPHDPTRSPGGSSGGSAISVAAGMALATIGTDTGGSIRIPAAACGIVGLKPTLGEVSIDGVVPLSRTLDHIGPLTQSVTDACLVYHALMGDASAVPPAPMPMHGLRLAVPRKYFCDLLDDEVRARFEEALERLRAAGARIDEIEIHHAAEIAPVYLHLVMADAAAYHAATLESMPEKYTPNVRLRLEMGRYVLGEDYVRALAGRARITREVDAALAQHDALDPPFAAHSRSAVGRKYRSGRCDGGAGSQSDAEAHPAVQRHRTSGDRHAERPDDEQAAVLGPAGRPPRPDGRAAARCAGVRASDQRRHPGLIHITLVPSPRSGRAGCTSGTGMSGGGTGLMSGGGASIGSGGLGKTGFGVGGCSKDMQAGVQQRCLQ